MSNPSIQQNRTSQTSPDLTDLLTLWKKDVLLSVNCHHVATVQSFDSETQTIQATINYKKTFFQRQADGTYLPVLQNYATLVDVPVIVLKGGEASLTMPIAAGDECLILFNDRDIDNWYQSGQVQGNASGRLHSFSDGFALIGVSSAPNVIEDYDGTRAALNNGTTRVAVSADKILIENISTTLNTQLQSLVTQLQSLCTQLGLLTVICAAPSNPSSIPVNAAAIATISTSIG